MTTSKSPWEQLREPFPPERVLQLPATAKRPELDYVGHADVTDRLLTVDPAWSWEWGVNDPQTGLPSKALSLTLEGDEWALWMALTVCGSTKRDVGYASADTPEALKHAISDALRRCAMRFGVALDLWEKDDRGTAPGANTQAPSGGGPTLSCPQCGKPLRDRKGAKGPFVGCSGYPECKFTRGGTLEELANGWSDDVDPDEINLPIPPAQEPPVAESPPADKLTAQVIALAREAGPEATLKAFKAVNAVDCLSMSRDGSYRMRKSELDKLSQETKLEIERLLEIPF